MAKRNLLTSTLNLDLGTAPIGMSAEISQSWSVKAVHPSCTNEGAGLLDGAGWSQHAERRPSQLKSIPFQLCRSPRNMTCDSIHQTGGQANGGESQKAGSHKGISQTGSGF